MTGVRYLHPVPAAAATGLVAEVYAQAEREFGLLPPLPLHSPLPRLLAGGDLAGAIRQRNRVLRDRAAEILAGHDREIAEIQRSGAHAHEDLARAWARALALG